MIGRLVLCLVVTKQRAVIARMFASDPDIFVLDEPTTGMDATTKSDFMS